MTGVLGKLQGLSCKMHIRDVNEFVASYVWAGRVLDIDDLM